MQLLKYIKNPVLWCCLVLLFAGTLPLHAINENGEGTARVVDSISPSMIYVEVNVLVEKDDKVSQETFKKNGLIISEDGYILTSFISSEIISNIKVFIGEDDYPAKIVGNDPITRISVIKIETHKKLKPAVISARPAKEGEWLVGIYLLDEELQMRKVVQYAMITTIIPSGKSDLMFFSTNLAYDGMVLSNMNREIVGFVLPFFDLNMSLLETRDKKIAREIEMMRAELKCVEIGPIKNSMEKIMHNKKNIEVSWVGAGLGALTRVQAGGMGIPQQGVLVTKVFKDSPAEKAGLKAKDVIYEIDGGIIAGDSIGLKAFIDTIRGCEPGGQMVFGVRRNKSELKLTVKPVKYPDPEKIKTDWLGLTVAQVDDTIYDSMNLFSNRGIVVVSIDPGSPAMHAELDSGDLITNIQSTEVTDKETWQSVVNKLQKNRNQFVTLNIYRGNRALIRVIKPFIGMKE